LQAGVRHCLDGVLVDERKFIDERAGHCFDQTVILRPTAREGYKYGGSSYLAALRFFELTYCPGEVVIEVRPPAKMVLGNDLEKRYGVANFLALDEEFAGEEVPQANGPALNGD